MKFIAKYGIGLYLLVSLLFKLNFIIPVSLTNILYYALMAGGIILFVFYSKKLFLISNKKAFGVFYTIILLNCAYLLFLNFDQKGLLYVIAKFSTANLIAFGLIFNFDFYKNAFVNYFKYIIAGILLLGYLFGISPEDLSGAQRLEIGFNPNDVGLFGSIGALSILIFNPKWFKSKVDILLFLFFILLTLLSGSKAALLNLVLGAFLIYGFKAKIIFAGIGFLLMMTFASSLGFTTAIDRLEKSNAFDTREDTFEKGLQTINDSFWTGHGLDKYAWTDPKYWGVNEAALGPHNAYFSTIIMYGAVFGGLFLFLLLLLLIKNLHIYFKYSDSFVTFCAIMILLIYVNALFESLIVGINEFITLIFWFALGASRYYDLNYKKC